MNTTMRNYNLGKKILLFIFACMVLVQIPYASVDHYLKFSKFRIESTGIDDSGKIVIEGKRDCTGKYLTIFVHAFGTKYDIPKNILDKIPNHQNGMVFTYNSGDLTYGERVVNLVFITGSGSHTDLRHIIAVYEKQKIEMFVSSD